MSRIGITVHSVSEIKQEPILRMLGPGLGSKTVGVQMTAKLDGGNEVEIALFYTDQPPTPRAA